MFSSIQSLSLRFTHRFLSLSSLNNFSITRQFLSTTSHPDLVRPITVRTCVGIYPELHQIWPDLYPRDAPQDGLDITVDYADTANLVSDPNTKFDKTILAIHGNPGNISHYDRLIAHYRGSNVRVIVPNLPDFTHTRESGNVFWHSTPEKVAFLRDFLAKLRVSEIDCLVAHSFGIQTAGALWEESSLRVNSVALFSTQPMWTVSPTAVSRLKRMFTFKSELWYNLLSLSRVYKNPDFRMKFDNVNEFLLLATHILDHRSPVDLHRRIDSLIQNTRVPVSLMYGSAESLVQERTIWMLYDKLGIAREDIVHVDPEVNEKSKIVIPQSGKRFNGYMIKGGGHFAHAKHYQYANRIVDNLISYHDDGSGKLG